MKSKTKHLLQCFILQHSMVWSDSCIKPRNCSKSWIIRNRLLQIQKNIAKKKSKLNSNLSYMNFSIFLNYVYQEIRIFKSNFWEPRIINTLFDRRNPLLYSHQQCVSYSKGSQSENLDFNPLHDIFEFRLHQHFARWTSEYTLGFLQLKRHWECLVL